MKRFMHFNENGQFIKDSDGAENGFIWIWDNQQKYFVKGDKSYKVFVTLEEPKEYWVSKFIEVN